VSSRFISYNITICWLYPLDGFRFTFLLLDSQNDPLMTLSGAFVTTVALFWSISMRYCSFLCFFTRFCAFRNPPYTPSSHKLSITHATTKKKPLLCFHGRQHGSIWRRWFPDFVTKGAEDFSGNAHSPPREMISNWKFMRSPRRQSQQKARIATDAVKKPSLVCHWTVFHWRTIIVNKSTVWPWVPKWDPATLIYS